MFFGLSFSELCSLFCCPPIPSRIAGKYFLKPPEPTYEFVEEAESKVSINFHDTAEWQHTDKHKEEIEVFYTQTSRGNRIACMFIRSCPDARYTILFSHGNDRDLGQMSSFYWNLSRRINCDIFSYDYSGFGASSGKLSEKNVYADIEAAWKELRSRYGVESENIILYGQSFGTAPTMDFASKYEVGGVILTTPFTSAMRQYFPKTNRTDRTRGSWFFDCFTNIDKAPKITAKTLIIHGRDDEVVEISHGWIIHANLQLRIAVVPLWVEGADQDNLESDNRYVRRLREFVEKELPGIEPSAVETADWNFVEN